MPFQSARDHQEPWYDEMDGLFLSEHITSLDEERHKVIFSEELSLLDKLTLISQLYAGQLIRTIYRQRRQSKSHLSRTGDRGIKEKIVVKSADKFHLVEVEDILAIYLVEGEEEDE